MSEPLPGTFLAQLPHARELGIELISFDRAAGRCAFRQPWRAELVGDPERQILHGGVITSLLDTLGAAAVIARGVKAQATLDLRVDYLRPAAAQRDLIAEAECYRVTRHVAFVRGLCHQGDVERPVANLTATFVVADRVVPVGTP
ncbi:MAG TPA: PaaI family thioesterase [Polyangiales bacterium]